jgi:ribosome-associated protein
MQESLKQTLTQAAEDKKAEDIELIDVKSVSDLCDEVFICSGQNERHTQAIAENIKEQMQKQHKLKPYVCEGLSEGQWILLDYGFVFVNVFTDEVRQHYSIEDMWNKRVSQTKSS